MNMPQRPTVSANLLAEVTQAAPSRFLRKLDNKPDLAQTWQWLAESDKWTVTTDRGETITLTPTQNVVRSRDQVTCTCLLAPRCLHILAVLGSLEIDEGFAQETPVTSSDERSSTAGNDSPGPLFTADGPRSRRVSLTRAQIDTARRALLLGAEILRVGALAVGPALQADLLRLIHDCRTIGLHRMATLSLRLLRGIRDVRSEKPDFTLEDQSEATLDLLLTATRLSRPEAGTEVEEALVGIARRRYEPVGSLELAGLFTEPITTTSGYAGVVTTLVDARRGLFTLNDVRPGDAQRAFVAYDRGVSIGEVYQSHRQLCRQSLIVQNATSSSDGRLGAGAGTSAVTTGPARWSDEQVAALWRQPLEAQLDRAFTTLGLPVQQRPVGGDLLFLRGRALGLAEQGLVLLVERGDEQPPETLLIVPPRNSESLRYRENLALLARGGVPDGGPLLWLIGRVRAGHPRTVEGLAAGLPATPPEDEEPALGLPEAFGDHVNLGLDRLHASFVAGARDNALALDFELEPQPDPLLALRRRVHRVVLGGITTLPSGAITELQREAALLRRAMMPTAAAVLEALGESATRGRRDFGGRRSDTDAADFARAWLRAAHYERTARRALARASWL